MIEATASGGSFLVGSFWHGKFWLRFSSQQEEGNDRTVPHVRTPVPTRGYVLATLQRSHVDPKVRAELHLISP